MKTRKLKQVKVNFSMSDYENISALASIENISIAQFIRNKFHTTIDNPPSKKSIVIYKDADPKLLFEINKIANYLNKIAKELNTKNQYEIRAIFEIYSKVMSLK
ncbi:MAG: signal transduction protein with GAF and PtsI domain [Sulfurimonas sp.]|jgi:signal transduction protein with GAF and PtsI domain